MANNDFYLRRLCTILNNHKKLILEDDELTPFEKQTNLLIVDGLLDYALTIREKRTSEKEESHKSK